MSLVVVGRVCGAGVGKVGIKFSQIAWLLAKGPWRPLSLSVVLWFSLHLNTAHASPVCMFVCMYGPFICMFGLAPQALLSLVWRQLI